MKSTERALETHVIWKGRENEGDKIKQVLYGETLLFLFSRLSLFTPLMYHNI